MKAWNARRVSLLEAKLAIQLVAVTVSGAELIERGMLLSQEAEHVLAAARSLERRLLSHQDVPEGVLRMIHPMGLHPMVVATGTTSPVSDNPGLRLRLRAAVRPAELLQDWGDVALVIGALEEGPWKARLVVRVPFGIVGSSAYAARRGFPERVEDLPSHTLAMWGDPDTEAHFLPLRGGGRIEVDPEVVSPDFHVTRLAAGTGEVLAYRPILPPIEDLARDLVPVLGETVGADVPTWFVVRSGQSRTARIRVLLEYTQTQAETLLRAVFGDPT